MIAMFSRTVQRATLAVTLNKLLLTTGLAATTVLSVTMFTALPIQKHVHLEYSTYNSRIELEQNGANYSLDVERHYSGAYKFTGDKKPNKEEVLNLQRRNIQLELEDNPLHTGLGVQTVAELVPELGGKAVSTLLVTSWRSGSSFLGEVLNAHPGTFYHYEPLHHFGVRQVRSRRLGKMAVDHISQLLHCNYTGLERFVTYSNERSNFMLAHNKRLRWVCKDSKSFCKKLDFLSSFCELFPFNLAKLDRLRMTLTEPLLEDRSLSVRVVLLVRDPRGTMRSRQPHPWCRSEADCGHPKRLCADLVSDFHAALQLQKKFPGRVLVIRFEDLASNALNATRDIYNFLSFNFSTPVQQYLQEHTKSNKNADLFSSYRNSSEVHLHWRKELTFKQVAFIQSQCREAMDLFGYRTATQADDLANFNPVDNFNFPPFMEQNKNR